MTWDECVPGTIYMFLFVYLPLPSLSSFLFVIIYLPATPTRLALFCSFVSFPGLSLHPPSPSLSSSLGQHRWVMWGLLCARLFFWYWWQKFALDVIGVFCCCSLLLFSIRIALQLYIPSVRTLNVFCWNIFMKINTHIVLCGLWPFGHFIFPQFCCQDSTPMFG